MRPTDRPTTTPPAELIPQRSTSPAIRNPQVDDYGRIMKRQHSLAPPDLDPQRSASEPMEQPAAKLSEGFFADAGDGTPKVI